MKIISDFEDYYDKIKDTYYFPGYSEIKYFRKTEQFNQVQTFKIKEKFPKEKIESVKYFSNIKDKWSLTFFYVGFCKKMYSGVSISYNDIVEVSYTMAGAIYIPSKYNIPLSEEILKNIKTHFSLLETCCSNVWDVIDVPSFIILPKGNYNTVIYKNPNLSEIQFFKNVNNFDAYHRIKLFLHELDENENENEVNKIWSFNPFFLNYF